MNREGDLFELNIDEVTIIGRLGMKNVRIEERSCDFGFQGSVMTKIRLLHKCAKRINGY